MAGEYIEFVNNSQPALNEDNLNLMQQLIRQDIQSTVSGDTLPVGAIMPFGSDTIPENWLLCNGQAVSRTGYQQLFNTIGTTFGQGDGFTTFNLPNIKGKMVIGKDENDTDFDTLGKTGGEKQHTLTIEEMPAHTHKQYSRNYNVQSATSGSVAGNYQAIVQDNTSSTGGDQPHDIMNPHIVGNYIIKAKQSAGIVATVVDSLNSTSATDALSANQGSILNEKINGNILYESNDGTSENITLTDDSNNYNFIDVSFFGNNGSTDITRVYDISKGVNLLTSNCNSSGTKIWFQTETITFLNNQLVRGTQAEVLLQQGVSIAPYSTTIKIFKVVGYK